MKFAALLVAAAPALASAFLAPTPAQLMQPAARAARAQGALRMVVMDDFKLDGKLAAKEVEKAGVSAPLGFFDPLGFYKDKTIRQKKKLRESEVKHGRVAMLAMLGIFVQEKYHPLLVGDVPTAVEQFNQLEDSQNDLWLLILFIASLAEFRSIARGWDPIEETLANPKIAGLRDEYVSGNNDYDPLSLCPDDDDSFIDMRTKELNNGRLAMIGLIGVIAQELVTGKPLFA